MRRVIIVRWGGGRAADEVWGIEAAKCTWHQPANAVCRPPFDYRMDGNMLTIRDESDGRLAMARHFILSEMNIFFLN